MSTHAQIGYMSNDGKIRAIYNHSDGYVEALGRMLVEHYNSHVLANALIDMGNVSSVHPNINPPTDQSHGFDLGQRQKDTCTFYHRERGDAWDDNKPTRHANADEFIEWAQEGFNSFLYVWMVDAWYVTQSLFEPWVRVIDHPDFKVGV